MIESDAVIKFAVVGLGHIGKRHATMVQEHPEAELVALVDVMSKEDLGLSDLDVPLFPDVESMLSAGIDLDVVNICTANGLHSAQALKALEHKKHVVVEKPLGLYTANCEQVISTALNVSRQVFCVMQNRYSPPSIWLKGLMDEKRAKHQKYLKDIAAADAAKNILAVDDASPDAAAATTGELAQVLGDTKNNLAPDSSEATVELDAENEKDTLIDYKAIGEKRRDKREGKGKAEAEISQYSDPDKIIDTREKWLGGHVEKGLAEAAKIMGTDDATNLQKDLFGPTHAPNTQNTDSPRFFIDGFWLRVLFVSPKTVSSHFLQESPQGISTS